MDNNKSLILEEENVTTLPSSISSSFRRRNNILILILTTFFISLALTTSAFSFYLVHYGVPESADSISANTSVRIFYSNAACTNPSCKEAFSSIIVGKSISDPTQILVLSLQAAATHLKDIISFLSSSSASASIDDGSGTDEKITTMFAFKNCSDSLRNGSGRIHEALGIIRVNPFAEMRSGDERFRLMKKISAAEEDLKDCVGDLGKVVAESTAVSEVIAKVYGVMVYVSSSGEFVYNYSSVLSRSWDEYDPVWDMIWNVFGVCVFGLEGWFIFFLFRKIWRSR